MLALKIIVFNGRIHFQMHLEIKDGKTTVCQVEIPRVDRQVVSVDCVQPPVEAFWLDRTDQIFVYHPKMDSDFKILIADKKSNQGVTTRFFWARVTPVTGKVRERKLRVNAVND